MNFRSTRFNKELGHNNSHLENIFCALQADKLYVTTWERSVPHSLTSERGTQPGDRSQPKDAAEAEQSIQAPKVVSRDMGYNHYYSTNSSTLMSHRCKKRWFMTSIKHLPRLLNSASILLPLKPKVLFPLSWNSDDESDPQRNPGHPSNEYLSYTLSFQGFYDRP